MGSTAGRKALEKVERLCDGGYELVGSGGAYGEGLTVVEGSHRPSNHTVPLTIISHKEHKGDKCLPYIQY